MQNSLLNTSIHLNRRVNFIGRGTERGWGGGANMERGKTRTKYYYEKLGKHLTEISHRTNKYLGLYIKLA